MRIRFLFVLSSTLFLIVADASAGPKEDVGATTLTWGDTLGQNDPDKVVALYAPDAVLWGTLSPKVRADERLCATISLPRSRCCPISRWRSVSN